MTGMFAALVRHFSGLGMPVHLAGWVPADARPPYITLTVEPADWRRVGYLAMTAWLPAAGDGNLRRLQTLEAAVSGIPPGGLRLVSEPDHAQALGGQLRFELVRYPTGSPV